MHDFTVVLTAAKANAVPATGRLVDCGVLGTVDALLSDAATAVEAAYQCTLRIVPTASPVGFIGAQAWLVLLAKVRDEQLICHGTLVQVIVREDYPVTLLWSEDGVTTSRADCRDYAGLVAAITAVLACPYTNARLAVVQNG